MPRYFQRVDELLDSDDVEVQWEEWEEGEGAVVWPHVLGSPDEQDDVEELLDLVRRLSLGRGGISDDELSQLFEIARRRIWEGSVALQPLAAGGDDDGRGGTRVATAAPAADDDDRCGRGRVVLLYHILRCTDGEEEGARRRGGGHRRGHGGGGPCDGDDPEPGPGGEPRSATTGGGHGEEGDGGPSDEDDPEQGPGTDPHWPTTTTGDSDGEEGDARVATMARVVMRLGFLAAVLACVQPPGDVSDE
jgi:hypothetical protein